jgi:hypothetical protein
LKTHIDREARVHKLILLHRKERKERQVGLQRQKSKKKSTQGKLGVTNRENQWTSTASRTQNVTFVDDLVTLRRTAEDDWGFAFAAGSQGTLARIALRNRLDLNERPEL